MSSPEIVTTTPEDVRLAAGMKPIEEMTDREIMSETLYWLRFAGEALAQMQSSGMGKMMMSMMGAKR